MYMFRRFLQDESIGRWFLMLFIGILIFTIALNVFAYRPGDIVVLKTTPTCSACKEAKKILNSHHIKYIEQAPNGGKFVPQLYVNGKFKGYGVDSVISYVGEK